jgi:hypothetical protein
MPEPIPAGEPPVVQPHIPTAADPSGRTVLIRWPDGRETRERVGRDWLVVAHAAAQAIPTGCLGGSCGACEIEVNGQVVRACIATVPACRQGLLRVELASDPYW